MAWYRVVSCVSELVFYRLLGVVLQVWIHVTTLLFVAHSVSAQNRPGPIHELSEGGMDGVVVHAKYAIRSCGWTTGSPRGTTLVVQPLEVCNTNTQTQGTRYQPIVFDLQTYFTWKWYVSGHRCLIKTCLLSPLYNCLWFIYLQTFRITTY